MLVSIAAKDRCRTALADALARIRGTSAFDPAQEGYVTTLADNLVDGVSVAAIERYFAGAAGHEMDGKMRAAYSSSALAANSFVPWLDRLNGLSLAGQSGFQRLEFEAVCPTGLKGTAPHLDVLLENDECVAGVESKCLEYLDSHRGQGFADSYSPVLDRSPVLGAVASEVSSYEHLNAAQLVKHMLGLLHTYEKPSILVYLFWEPVDWRVSAAFGAHRAEVRRFAAAMAGGPVTFRAMTYRQLWDEWSLQAGPVWLAHHVERLCERYEVRIEGAAR